MTTLYQNAKLFWSNMNSYEKEIDDVIIVIKDAVKKHFEEKYSFVFTKIMMRCHKTEEVPPFADPHSVVLYAVGTTDDAENEFGIVIEPDSSITVPMEPPTMYTPSQWTLEGARPEPEEESMCFYTTEPDRLIDSLTCDGNCGCMFTMDMVIYTDYDRRDYCEQCAEKQDKSDLVLTAVSERCIREGNRRGHEFTNMFLGGTVQFKDYEEEVPAGQ